MFLYQLVLIDLMIYLNMLNIVNAIDKSGSVNSDDSVGLSTAV